MRVAICIIAFNLLSGLQSSALADDLSATDECRAKIRAQIRGPVCQKPDADRQGDPCFISAREAMHLSVNAALC